MADEEISPVNSDWLRVQTWDVWATDLSQPAATLAELRDAVGQLSTTDEQWRDWLAKAVELPFWQPAPQPLKDEAKAFLSDRPTGSAS